MNIHLCFHGIGACTREREAGEAKYWVSTDRFRAIADEIAGHANVRLSFDDGNSTDIDVALPELRARGLTVTFFPLAGRLGERGSVAAGDLGVLRAAGVRIGSHGWAHVPWRGLDRASLTRELVDARVRLEAASGASITDAALPLGRYDRGLLRRLKEAGYTAVYTSDRFPVRDSSWLRARYSVTADDTVESVRWILRRRPGLGETRQVLASAVKRLR